MVPHPRTSFVVRSPLQSLKTECSSDSSAFADVTQACWIPSVYRCVSLDPGVGKKIIYVGRDRAGREFIEHVAEIQPRVQSVPRRAGADAQQHRGGFQPAVAAQVQPIGAADGKRTNGPFGLAVVDRESRVIEVANERSPLIPGILDGLTEQTLWRRLPMLHFEPISERRQDRPGPRLSQSHHLDIGELFTKLVAFVFDLAFDGVERAYKSQVLDCPRIARLGLDKVSSGMHPAAEMAKVVVDGVVAVVRVGMNKAAIAFEESLRERLTPAGGEVEKRVRVLRIAEIDPGVGGPPGPQE